MKKNKKLWQSLLLLLCAGALVLFVVLDMDREAAMDALNRMDVLWLLLAFGCMLVYYTLDAAKYQMIARSFGHPQSFFDSITTSLLGLFYSAVTPLAAGGQPFQVVRMHKRGMSTGAATSIIAMSYSSWHISLMILGLLGLILFGRSFAASGTAYFVMFLFGLLIQVVLVSICLLSALYPEKMDVIGDGVICWFLKFRLFSRWAERKNHWCDTWHDFVFEYYNSFKSGSKHAYTLAAALLIALAQCAAYMSVAFCAYRGLGMAHEKYFQFMFIQVMLYLAVSFVPLPGASVASEGGFYIVFRSFFGDLRAVGMLLWRLATYYLTILFGFIAVLVDQMTGKKVKHD